MNLNSDRPTYFNSPKQKPVTPPVRPINWTPVVITAIAAGTMISITDIVQQKRSSPPAKPVTEQVVPTPTQAPTPVPTPTPTVLRALLYVPRAKLVSVPVGSEFNVQMPDGTLHFVHYMGRVANFSQLPHNPHYNDMWSVTESGASWVWCWPGFGPASTWVDP